MVSPSVGHELALQNFLYKGAVISLGKSRNLVTSKVLGAEMDGGEVREGPKAAAQTRRTLQRARL